MNIFNKRHNNNNYDNYNCELSDEEKNEILKFKNEIKKSWYYVRENNQEKINKNEAILLKTYNSFDVKIKLVENNYYIEDYMNEKDEKVRNEIGKRALYFNNTEILKNSLYYQEIVSELKTKFINPEIIVERLNNLLSEFNESSESAVLIRIIIENENIRFGFYSIKNIVDHPGKRILNLTRMYNSIYRDYPIYFKHDI